MHTLFFVSIVVRREITITDLDRFIVLRDEGRRRRRELLNRVARGRPRHATAPQPTVAFTP